MRDLDQLVSVLPVTAAAPVVLSQKIRRADAPLNLRRGPHRPNVDPNI
ncbi:hypothetical protein L083_6731 [Actinoplanes sp. N902-109]|nr:hypothetical protein L083_6731 [Actinoplanes sp. N902-109]